MFFLTTQKMKFSIKDFFSKCDQTRRKLSIWSNLLTKSLMENFILCAVSTDNIRKIIKNSILILSLMAHGHRMLRIYMIKICDTEIFKSLKIITVCSYRVTYAF